MSIQQTKVNYLPQDWPTPEVPVNDVWYFTETGFDAKPVLRVLRLARPVAYIAFQQLVTGEELQVAFSNALAERNRRFMEPVDLAVATDPLIWGTQSGVDRSYDTLALPTTYFDVTNPATADVELAAKRGKSYTGVLVLACNWANLSYPRHELPPASEVYTRSFANSFDGQIRAPSPQPNVRPSIVE